MISEICDVEYEPVLKVRFILIMYSTSMLDLVVFLDCTPRPPSGTSRMTM